MQEHLRAEKDEDGADPVLEEVVAQEQVPRNEEELRDGKRGDD